MARKQIALIVREGKTKVEKDLDRLLYRRFTIDSPSTVYVACVFKTYNHFHMTVEYEDKNTSEGGVAELQLKLVGRKVFYKSTDPAVKTFVRGLLKLLIEYEPKPPEYSMNTVIKLSHNF